MTMKTLLDGLAYEKMDDLVRRVLIRDYKAAKCGSFLKTKLLSEPAGTMLPPLPSLLLQQLLPLPWSAATGAALTAAGRVPGTVMG